MSYKRSIAIGAAIGFAFAMLKKNSRQEFVKDSKEVIEQIKYTYNNPNRAINDLQNRLIKINGGTVKLIEQLEQVETYFKK